MCAHHVAINKELFDLQTRKLEGECWGIASNTHPLLYVIRCFIYLTTHCHLDILVTLHIWHTTISRISSSYRRLRRAYPYYTHLLPLLISYIDIVPGSTHSFNISSSYRRLRHIVPAVNISQQQVGHEPRETEAIQQERTASQYSW